MSLRTWWESRAGTTQNDYTALRLAEAVERVTGGQGLRGTEAYQGALNAIENAASVAEIEGQFSEALTPHLGSVARGLVDCGESTFELQVDGEGRLLLLPAKITAVSGTADPATWRYLLARKGPTESASIERPAAAVVAFRQHSDPNVPWRGTPALAANYGALLADLQNQLRKETALPVSRVINAGIAVSEQRGDVYRRRPSRRYCDSRIEQARRGGCATNCNASRENRGWIRAGVGRATRTLDPASLRGHGTALEPFT